MTTHEYQYEKFNPILNAFLRSSEGIVRLLFYKKIALHKTKNMNKILLLSLLLSWVGSQSYAQSIERQIIGTAGEIQTISGTAIVSFSIGEPIIESHFLANNHITQGFQQGEKSAALPVNLLTFDANRLNPLMVDLDWEAVWSGDFQGFWIERQLEGETEFQSLKFVTKSELEGVQKYNHQDNNSHFEESYYRLKMLEADGSFKYSAIKSVKGTPLVHRITAFPNPFDEFLQVEIIPDTRQLPVKVQIQLFSADGLMVKELTVPFSHLFTINQLEHLPKGWYFLKIKMDKQESETVKVVKQ
jgi:hypothetical protein